MKPKRSTDISLEQITETLRRHKERLQQNHGIEEIGVFGSFVRGEQKKRSDIDVLVEFEEVPGLIEFIQIEEDLHRLLKKKVDLVRKGALRPELKDRILNEVIYL
jgi:predicted nucleotidyltransferase